jgi:hypothetical protein
MSPFTQGGFWVVEDNGHMKYRVGEEDILEIEPETLTHKTRMYELSADPEFDETEFFIQWLKALKLAKIEEVTIKIQ